MNHIQQIESQRNSKKVRREKIVYTIFLCLPTDFVILRMSALKVVQGSFHQGNNKFGVITFTSV